MTRHMASVAIARWVRPHPIGAFCVWFFPVAWAIALLPLLPPRPFGLELPLEVFLSAATLFGGLVPVVVITRMVDGPQGIAALGRRLLPSRASLGWYALAVLAVTRARLGLPARPAPLAEAAVAPAIG